MRLSCSPGGEIPTQGRLGAPLTRRRASASVVAMIEISALTKRYGRTTAVSDLTFTVQPGVVTGFLGPNGAGKSTTMRMILGLDEPTSGSVTVNGRAPRARAAPLHDGGGTPGARGAARAPRRAAARGRRHAGPAGGAPVPQRLPSPARARPDHRHPPVPG